MINIDGLMDEAIWNSVPEYTDFRLMPNFGSPLAKCQTSFKLLPYGDSIYIGIKCEAPDMAYLETCRGLSLYGSEHVEILISPAGSTTSFYQFFVGYTGQTECHYYEESGNIKPDPYAPVWNSAVYLGEDYWSAEVEILLWL